MSTQILPCAYGQTELATVFGRVTDPSGAVVAGADVEIRNVETNLAVMSATNGDGLYSIPSLHPGHYVMSVRKTGFKTVSVTQLDLNVQDNVVRNFALEVGSSSESVTVTAEVGKINTMDATVSTVVDRNFADNLPMNGRSFQTLIELTPGITITSAGNGFDSGQFSVNGQRASSNYWMVDGVGANIGIGAFLPSNGLSGSLGGFSAQGGTNSLVSVDAMEEFRVQTSTYAPEFGRTPGAQLSIVTRSGGNAWHGSLFDYLRNDLLDANDWFADHNQLPKPEERQNDFGGTFSGPIKRDRTFFFFSYEGLRLRLPQVSQTTVPDIAARQGAVPAMQPFLNAFPLPNGIDLGQGVAQFNASFSNRSTLNAYSLRVDHKLGAAVTLFARYNYSPSSASARGVNSALNSIIASSITTQTATVGATWLVSPVAANDIRLNYSKTNAESRNSLDGFGGAIPLSSPPFPGQFTTTTSEFGFDIFSLSGSLNIGPNARNVQRQFNIVDGLTLQKGAHSIKVGVDYRRLSPIYDPAIYSQAAFFNDVPSAGTGTLSFALVASNRRATLLLRNLGAYAQDTWRPFSRLSLTYGLRWDVDFAPAALDGPNFPAASNFNLNDLSQLSLAPPGKPPFNTRYANLAPRLGMAFGLLQSPNWASVIRGGIGLFYDLATQEAGNVLVTGSYPFSAQTFPSGSFPLDSAGAAPPLIVPPGGGVGTLTAFDPNIELPYTLQWNVSIEQQLHNNQALSFSYIGAAGRRLLQTAFVSPPNPNLALAQLISNSATSDYDAFQLKFQRRLSKGLQALASYSLSHSIDDASASSFGNEANTLVPTVNPITNRGASDFDVRHSVSGALTYDLPSPRSGKLAKAIVSHWATENILQAHSSPPVNVHDAILFGLFNGLTEVRPDVVEGRPFYLYGPQYPGNKALNINAFASPPLDPNTGEPFRQGDLGRNALRAFPAFQWDFAVHRTFPIGERANLQFRAELFNVLNHPNFGPPIADISNTQFGVSTQTLGQYLAGVNVGGGALSPLYQIGGPRSVQFALKLLF